LSVFGVWFMTIERATVIAKMRGALRVGMSASAFISEMKEAGLSYRRTDMLADWREVGQIEKKEGLARFVRKGYIPTERTAELEVFAVSAEYLYKIKAESRLRPDEPVTTRFVNILSDVPMSVEMIEAEVERKWGEWERYSAEELVGLQVWSAMRSQQL